MCVGRPSQLDIDHRQPGHGEGDDMPSEPVDGAITDNGEQLPGGDQIDEGIQADQARSAVRQVLSSTKQASFTVPWIARMVRRNEHDRDSGSEAVRVWKNRSGRPLNRQERRRRGPHAPHRLDPW